MPSPFPGMDPYLEGKEWMNFHIDLCAEISRQLAPKVSPKYIVRTMRRFVPYTFDDSPPTSTIPDIGIAEPQAPYKTKSRSPEKATIPLQIETFVYSRVPQAFIEIRDADERTLITAIELLSPANKNGKGYRNYLKKRQKILTSNTHLLEIDLLQHGKRVPMRQPLPKVPYFIFLSRAEKRPVLDVWPLQFKDKLPPIPIPLLPEDDDVELDLQAALNTGYDNLRYDLSIDYSQPPGVGMPAETRAWAKNLIF